MALTFSKKKELIVATKPAFQKLDLTPAKKGEYWDLDKNGVSQGMLLEYLACRERARLGYIEGFTPVGTSNAITFGSLFHTAMEGIYKHVQKRKEVNNSEYLANTVDFVLNQFKEQTSKERVWTVEDEQNHLLNTGYLRILVPAYVSNYINKDKKQEWLIVEDDFKNKYRDVTLKGRYDQVYKNQYGEIWIKEMKTKSRIDPTIQDRLSFDFQAMFYIFNYWLEFQVMPAGFVYDIILRPGLRQGKNENLKHFMDRIKGDVDETYFMRIRMRVTAEEMDAWVKNDFTPILSEFREWAIGASATYRNPASCETRYGACKFLKVCGLKDYANLFRKPHGLLEEKVI